MVASDGKRSSKAGTAPAAPTNGQGATPAPSSYDFLYQAFGKRRDTRPVGAAAAASLQRFQISNPVPQHDILHEKRKSAKPRVFRVGGNSSSRSGQSVVAAAAAAAAAEGSGNGYPALTGDPDVDAALQAFGAFDPPSDLNHKPRSGKPLSVTTNRYSHPAAQPASSSSSSASLDRRVRPPAQEPPPNTKHSYSAPKVRRSTTASMISSSSANGANDEELAALEQSFSARFGSIGLPGANKTPALKRRQPKTRPSLASMASLQDLRSKYQEEQAEALATQQSRRRAAETAQSFENMHKLAEIEFFFLGKELTGKRENRTLLRDDVVYKVTLSSIESRKEPRRIFLLSDMLIYGTPIKGAKTHSLKDAYSRQTVMPLTDIQISPVDDQAGPLVDIETSTQYLQVAFASPDQRDSWVAAVRSAARSRRAYVVAQRKRRSSTASSHGGGNSLTEWGFRRLWQGIDLAISPGNRRGTVVPRKASVAAEDEGDGGGWIPDEEATVCMICQNTKFSLLTRKHHCRQCGRVICWKCSRTESNVRLCTECHEDNDGV
ncbi:uncharacterized protein EV422DRAFT_616820 [Fimicolochytrium jonesii]|uniref:uncharacterized protein n=1 Tax=Fimicolochytrium jonesii TaxID=1396493 RepID=UPI0022FE425D|nr:uncharacterized protein EV422DRAFT_616820 [Fimicolochytrium jonesii]KAI8825767.1 hypothetical protein EV422DRAFT_616820 [Fimicolochytrium jonesii]